MSSSAIWYIGTRRCSVCLLAVLQGVVESKNNFLVYKPVSVSFNIKVFIADSLIKQSLVAITIMKTHTVSQY